jgi:hypothetical protein
MSCLEDYIQNHISIKLQPLAKEISNELSDLLKNLKEKKLLREKLSGELEEKRHIIVEAQRNNDAILASFSKFYKFYFNPEQQDSYYAFMSNNGFNDLDLMHLLHSQFIFAFLTNMEMLKNFFNLILENSSSENTLGHLFGKNGLLTQNSKAISKRLDIDLRNALSHYTFIEEGPFIHYYNYRKDKQTKTVKLYEARIKSSELHQKTIEVSIMKALLACLIADLYAPNKK